MSQSRGPATRYTVDYQAIQGLDDMARIKMIRARLREGHLRAIAVDLGVPASDLAKWLGAHSPSGKARRADAFLSQCMSERLVRVVCLIARTLAWTPADIGRQHDFGWLGTWLSQPVPAIGFHALGTLLDTQCGCDLVARTLQQAVDGTYA